MKKLINPIKAFLALFVMAALIFVYIIFSAMDANFFTIPQFAIMCSIALFCIVAAAIGYNVLSNINDN